MIWVTGIRCALVGVVATLSLSAMGDLPFVEAVRNRDRAAIERLIAAGTEVNGAQPNGATALSWAVYLNDAAAAQMLLKAGAEPNVTDEYGDSPLTLAAANGNGELVLSLLDAGAKADAARANGETALMLAAGSGSLKAVQRLVVEGADVNATGHAQGQTALMWAAEGKHSAIVDYLVAHGADVMAASKGGFTALAFAATKNDAQAIHTMLKAGADPKLVLPDGTSVLMAATAYGNVEAAGALIEGGADVTVANSKGQTPLHAAAQLGNLTLVNQLLAKGAAVDALTNEEEGTARSFRFGPPGQITPLMAAANAAHIDVMKALIDAGADTSIRSQDGSSLLFLAVASGRVAAVEYAFQYDDDVTVKNDQDATLMHRIASSRLGELTEDNIVEVIDFLAEKGAALDEEDARKRTPISLADNLPITKAVNRLYELVLASNNLPKILPTDLQ